MSETKLKKILEFVNENDKICPKPQKWQELWDLLPNKQRIEGRWNPPLPLILAAWWETNDFEKKERLYAHIHYAESENALDLICEYLENLTNDDWIYKNEV